MDDLPTENNGVSKTENDDNPIFQTLEAMKRVKTKNEALEEALKSVGIVIAALEVRVTNLEKGFQIACKDVEGPLKDHFDKLLAQESNNDDSESSEEEGEQEEGEEEIPAKVGGDEESD